MANTGTGKPVPSEDVRDLLANATNLDDAINGDADDWADRLGRLRRSWAGFQRDFTAFVESNRVYGFATWETASAAAGAAQIPVASTVEIVGDEGTHVDPVTGATVSNSGRFVMTAGGLEFRSADSLAAKADKAAVEAMIRQGDVDDVALAIAFEDRSRTWMEATRRGRPTGLAGDLIVEATKEKMAAAVGVDGKQAVQGLAAAIYYPETRDMLVGFREDGLPLFSGPTPYTSQAFVAYGDSTTYGADLVSPLTERWSTLLAAQLGVPIDNMGISGARSEEIQARFGAVDAEMSPAGGSIPANGTVVLNMVDINPVRLGGNLPCELMCEGGERVSGVLAFASATSATFTRTAAGTAVTTARVRVLSTLGSQYRGRVLFLGQGINNEPLIDNGTQTVSQIKAWYRAAARHQSAAKSSIVVWGLLDRGISEAPGTPRGDFIAEMEAWLAEEFAADFCPVRQFLASDYAFTIAARFQPGFTPTSDDTAAVAAKTIPPSLRINAGSVHLNALGHKLQAWRFNQHLHARGLI